MIIQAKWIIPGDGKTILEDAAILVRNGLIEKLADQKTLRAAKPEEPIVDYGHCTLVPGYIDCHTHIGCYDGVWDIDDYGENGYRRGIFGYLEARQCFAFGVTTIRDAGCPDMLLESLRKMAANGLAKLPRIFHCNQAIAMTGGHCWKMSIVTQADGIEGLRKAIRKQIRSGADWIKIMTTHRIGSEVEYSQEELNFAVQEAHRLGKKCFIHAALQPGLEMAIQAGPDSIEHGTFLTKEQAIRMRDAGIYWAPTLAATAYLVPILQKRIQEHAGESNAYLQRQIKDCEFYARNCIVRKERLMPIASTGVKVVAGTDFDTGYGPSAPVGMELRLMAQYGMPPLMAIETSLNAAQMLGLQDVGLIQEGYQADIAVLGGNPLEDYYAFEDIRATYLGGDCVFEKNGGKDSRYKKEEGKC